MIQDSTDLFMKELARSYRAHLFRARAAHPGSPLVAGRMAQNNWIADLKLHGCTAIHAEPRTGVDSRYGSQTRFDVLFTAHGMDIYVEVQATKNDGGYKGVQAQGQVIGFAHASAGAGVPARYYKIYGDPPEIHRWTRRGAQKGLVRAEYEPQVMIRYL